MWVPSYQCLVKMWLNKRIAKHSTKLKIYNLYRGVLVSRFFCLQPLMP